MPRTLTVGFDGSPESRAAAEWAAREATLRGLPLRLVNVWEGVPDAMAEAPVLGAETLQHWSERVPREAAAALRSRHPGLDVTTKRFVGSAFEVLPAMVKESELLVLGSRGLSGVGGFMIGSVGLSVVAHAERPVVLVRAGEQAADEHTPGPTGLPSATTPYRPVVLGLDTDSPDDTVLEFAFDAAARRQTSLRIVHGWNPPPYYAYRLPGDLEYHGELSTQQAKALAEAVLPWRRKYPAVEAVEESRWGRAANFLMDASREASLVVVGRRIRRSALGAHIGPVTHAVLHHSTAPVAVVPHA
ncbi:universal stress protein [Streptomyces justiciae]|uniref:Universal stress protein n=1 Tax=Streptomyces justiciae TaxID=2780140 RepID=A0ABU3LL80_9ACTN|nr:universal stress protein [Streptomyces justiciae]MDT7839907.1 universal stress protein [Streptomyces justiciae]